MDATNLVMVFFTVVSQMAVGAFLVLGVVRLFLSRGRSPQTVDRVVRPILYVIGPVLVLGLIVSMLHMHDVTNVIHVITNWQSSWLSREIIFGCLFAGAGFLFALLEWFQKGPAVLRHLIAATAAAFGVCLVVAQAMIYYSLVAIPAWHSWAVPFQFGATTLLLGCLGVAAGLMITTWIRLRDVRRAERLEALRAEDEEVAAEIDAKVRPAKSGAIRARIAEINAPATDDEWRLTAAVTQGTALVGAVVAMALLWSYPLFIGGLSQGNAAAVAAAGVLSGPLLWWRLALTGLSVILLGFFVYQTAGKATLAKARALVIFVLVAFVLALAGEFLGRFLHYLAMFKAGL